MRIRAKEIRRAHKRQEERYKAAHKKPATPAAAPARASRPPAGRQSGRA